MSLSTKQEFIAELSGNINGAPISVVGGGQIDPSGGIASGIYRVQSLPPDFAPAILSGCLLTGYPNVCALRAGAENPFGARPYHYTRKLSFRHGGRLQLTTKCGYEDGKLVSSFHVTGEVRTPELVSVEPIVESWEPVSKNTLRGHFVIAWRTLGGTLFVADARSKYVTGREVDPERLLHRHIAVTPSYHNGVFSLYQESELFTKMQRN